jgi:hypothetical protein
MSKKNTLHFEISANLQKLIGEELVANKEMAFIELIKNAYVSPTFADSLRLIADHSDAVVVVPKVPGLLLDGLLHPSVHFRAAAEESPDIPGEKPDAGQLIHFGH